MSSYKPNSSQDYASFIKTEAANELSPGQRTNNPSQNTLEHKKKLCFRLFLIKAYVHSRWLQKRKGTELTMMDSMMLGSVEDPLQGSKITDELLEENTKVVATNVCLLSLSITPPHPPAPSTKRWGRQASSVPVITLRRSLSCIRGDPGFQYLPLCGSRTGTRD